MQKVTESLNPYLIAARQAAERGEYAEAEKQLRQTLLFSQESSGKDSPQSGLVLLELWDFYEKQGQEAKADECWESIRAVVLAHMSQAGISPN